MAPRGCQGERRSADSDQHSASAHDQSGCWLLMAERCKLAPHAHLNSALRAVPWPLSPGHPEFAPRLACLAQKLAYGHVNESLFLLL